MRIQLREVTIENWYLCTQLNVAEKQRMLFPAPIVYWIAESKYVCEFEPLAIYNNLEIVGFIVYCSKADADGNHWIPALMVDERFQNRGYAKEAMKQLIELMKTTYNCNKIMIGHRPENEVAGRLYESLGFSKTSDELVDGEIVRVLRIRD